MNTYSKISELREALVEARRSGKTIGFVPTMGNLHAGHLSLVKEAHEYTDCVVVSIFVNPLQFGANEDLDKYPRTLAADKEKLIGEGADILFTPMAEEIYPQGMEIHTKVIVPELGLHHCGESRPGHFDGVSTIVTKLLNIVGADFAVFGQKDFQQLAIIRKMVEDLCIPTRIIGVPTCRAEDGLALSSRNQYLAGDHRDLASVMYRILLETRACVLDGVSIEAAERQASEALVNAGFELDYFNISDAITLKPASADTRQFVILAAAFLGGTRLIDNLAFECQPFSQ